MSTARRGEFVPKNPSKYVGKQPIIYRSSWEMIFMTICDEHDSVAQWASEPAKIPYRNPVTGKQTVYVPDFLISYVDPRGNKRVELVEVKPLKETVMEKSRHIRDRVRLAINRAKWAAAHKWARKRGIKFTVITEAQLFSRIGALKK